MGQVTVEAAMATWNCRAVPLAALSFLLAAAPAGAVPLVPQPYDGAADREALAAHDPGWLDAHADTVWFGGSGFGNGAVVRGGVWNWEADSGEAPEFFLDGDPVGNQYRDGWTFADLTTHGDGPSALGTGHWRTDGTYDFDFDGGAFAHRATTHANNGANDGPDPLAGGWSVWIGTNLHLNPEHCGWGGTAGYGDGWSQAVAKQFRFRNAPGPGEFMPPAPNALLDLTFFHRYAVEQSHDTCWVEISADGVRWEQVGTVANGNGIWTGGTLVAPEPGPLGGPGSATLGPWPGGEGDLWVRLRLATDDLVSDESAGRAFLFAWQVDEIAVRANGMPIDRADFETGMSGWEPRRCEGQDVVLTGDPLRPAGRIAPLSAIACPPVVPCPEACAIEGNVLLFADQDECAAHVAKTAAVSPPFAIGGGAHPDLDGDVGRLFLGDVYADGGSGLFDAMFVVCFHYWPVDANHCPYAPPPGSPGAGAIFNWSSVSATSCQSFALGAGARCQQDLLHDMSSYLPATADSVILAVGMYSQCIGGSCNPSDASGPFIDNMRFGVYDSSTELRAQTYQRYADSFPTSNTGFPLSATARMDGAYTPVFGGPENPPRWVRPDTAGVEVQAPNAAVFLRFAVERGACQPNLMHPFFAAFPPSAPGSFPDALLWHEARMDTARWYGGGLPGGYMTCFHDADAGNGTHWTGAPPGNEPCDDILPDGLFTPGTTVYYFFEARDAVSSQVLGTFPFGRGRQPITTEPSSKGLWLQSNVLPSLAPDCSGAYAHSMLVVSDYATQSVPGRATVERERLVATLSSLGLGFDVYDVVATNYSECYDGIGRREDRPTQQPRPPHNGATDLMLAGYDCIWYTAGLSDHRTLSDRRTLSLFGGQPSMDQQKLETWLAGCSEGNPRLLLVEGTGWAADIDQNTTNGPSFLANRGVDVLARDYAQQLAANDLRRCARLAGTALAPDFAGEAFGSGCPDDVDLNVLGAINSGEPVAHFVESLEDGHDPVNCADDVARPAWQAVVRKTNPNHSCEKSVTMSFAFAELLPLDCVEQCLFDNFVVNGANAELLIDLFQWAGQPVNAGPIGVGPEASPRLVNALAAVAPNPVSRRGTAIRYSIATRGRVTLRICDVSGRLVRTLVDEEQEPIAGGRAVVWDGRNDAGRAVGRGVYLYELRAPGYVAARKLVVLE